MARETVRIVVICMAIAAALIFAGVAKTELDYVSAHPYAFGPAKVIAWGAGAGVLISLAVGLLAWSLRDGQD
ncbi:MAG: hypothetical protein ACPHCI_01605 [Solirubrobacterales bacterium]